MQHSVAIKARQSQALRRVVIEPPQPLGIAQAVNLAKPIDIAKLANLTNCKIVPVIVNPDGTKTGIVPFFLALAS